MRSRHTSSDGRTVPASRVSPLQLLRSFEPGDEAAILRAHGRVFAKVDPTFQPKDAEAWRWKFQQCPAGSKIALAIGADGEVQGQYAGLRQLVRTADGPVSFAQAVDSFSIAPVLGGLSHASAFVRAGEFFANSFCGAADGLEHVVWGLAIPAVWRIGFSRLGYEHVRTVNALTARLSELSNLPVDGMTLEESAHCPADLAALYDSVATERGASAVRDAEWMNWRFGAPGSGRYRFGSARQGGQLRGLCVFRLGSFAGQSGGLICDWIVPQADDLARQSLFGWLRAQTQASGATQLIALFADTAPEWVEFQQAGFRVVPTEYILAARCFRAPFDRDYLFWRWHYTLADTDLV